MDGNPVVQKLKGKLKRVEGQLQEVTGDTLGGKIKQLEGETEEKIAELRIRHKSGSQIDEEEEERIREEEVITDTRAPNERNRY